MSYINRNDAIKEIKANLKSRSGKTWSVRGGQGTAWGWIKISVTPSQAINEWGYMSEAQQEELGKLLGLDQRAHNQGVNIPSGSDYYREYIDRSAGRTPSVYGKQYWD